MTGERDVDVVVDVDYRQFYAKRADGGWASDRVPSHGYEEHLWSDGSFVYVGTTRRHGPIPIRVALLDEAPTGEVDPRWQHIAEVSLRAGGDLQIFSWGADVPEATIAIDPGPVRLRASWTGLVPGRFEGLDDEGNSDEALLLQVWPADVEPSAVVRWWEARVLPPPSDTSPDGRRQAEGLEGVMARLPALELIARPGHPYPAMPGGGEHSSVNAILVDPTDGTWWADGYDVRRVLREVTEDEGRRLASRPTDDPAP